MSTCKRIKIDKNTVCMGDHRHPISIQTRIIVAPGIGESQASEDFTLYADAIAGIKTVGSTGLVSARGVRKFNGINIDNSATHLFFVMYADLFFEVEIKNNFILFNGDYYTIISVDNINEDNLEIMYQCSLRGDSSKEASNA